AAIGPKRVHAALDGERAALAKAAFEYLAVIPDVFHHHRQPIVGKVQRRYGRRAEGDRRIVRGLAVGAIAGEARRRDAALLGIDEAEERPAHETGPRGVALARGRP